RYGLDYKKLAKNNGIGRSYSIFPGQIINLAQAAKPISKPSLAPPPTVSPKARIPSTRSNNIQTANKTNISPVVVNKPPTKSVPSVRSEKKSIPLPRPAPVHVNKGKIYWKWPTGGRVLTNFYTKRTFKKGIDIEGKKGESVIAAAAGEVVYAGSGLRGYGKLIIIKHNDTYLSAYAHNNRLRVKEGQSVKAGQRIADIGSTGTGTNGKPKLHFQIRRNGKPIDPLPLLPKRK
ncbi:MAG: peptidoglycan DD-metalloendopeptidase family protein, partial [Cellvibrionaceae bacterium]